MQYAVVSLGHNVINNKSGMPASDPFPNFTTVATPSNFKYCTANELVEKMARAVFCMILSCQSPTKPADD